MSEKMFGLVNYSGPKELGSKKFCVKYFKSKQVLDPKKIWGKKKFLVKKKKLGPAKLLGP